MRPIEYFVIARNRIQLRTPNFDLAVRYAESFVGEHVVIEDDLFVVHRDNNPSVPRTEGAVSAA